jgi:hypothetical protein
MLNTLLPVFAILNAFLPILCFVDGCRGDVLILFAGPGYVVHTAVVMFYICP